MDKKKCIAIIFGGQSSEHEVSRRSAESVIRNIDGSKYDIMLIGITKDGRWLEYNGPVDKIGNGEWQTIAEANSDIGSFNLLNGNYKEKINAVFPVLHGCNGEDGTIQGVLELAGIPYVGSGVLGSALGMDKAYSKLLFEIEGIPQGGYLVFNRKTMKSDTNAIIKKVEVTLGYPCFIKPCNAGSSVGVNKASNEEQLIRALEIAFQHDRKVLVEEFIDGREIECAVLGNDNPIASVLGEIVPGNDFYDYNAKYIDNNSKTQIPAQLPDKTTEKIREYAVRAFKVLGCAGLSRVDFFVHNKTGEIYINEINTLPGFTNISMYPQLWEASGIAYKDLISKLIDLAIERYEEGFK